MCRLLGRSKKRGITLKPTSDSAIFEGPSWDKSNSLLRSPWYAGSDPVEVALVRAHGLKLSRRKVLWQLLELELIRTQMAQKPVLRAEVYARASGTRRRAPASLCRWLQGGR
jgi:hypothetical protein